MLFSRDMSIEQDKHRRTTQNLSLLMKNQTLIQFHHVVQAFTACTDEHSLLSEAL